MQWCWDMRRCYRFHRCFLFLIWWIPFLPKRRTKSFWFSKHQRCIRRPRLRDLIVFRSWWKFHRSRITRFRRQLRRQLVVGRWRIWGLYIRNLRFFWQPWWIRRFWRIQTWFDIFGPWPHMGRSLRWWFRWQQCIWKRCSSNLHHIRGFRKIRNNRLIVIRSNLPSGCWRRHRRIRWLR